MRFTTLCGFLAVIPALNLAAPADDSINLDEQSYLRCYLRFGQNRYSPAALRDDGEKTLGKTGWDKLKRETERLMVEKQGLDPAKADWRECVLQPVWQNYVPVMAAAPADGWAGVDFDDRDWVRQRRPFQGGPPLGITTPNLGQYDEAAMDMNLQHAYYRVKFVVADPAKSGDLTLNASYHGGVRVLVNGQEVVKGNVQKNKAGELVGDDYPKAVYDTANPVGAAQRARSLTAVVVPAKLLRAGVNVLAIEVHASDFHPVVLTNPRQPNWGNPTRPFPHNKLISFSLRSAGTVPFSGKGTVPFSGSMEKGTVPLVGEPPQGGQSPFPKKDSEMGTVPWAWWVEDIHHRVETTDILPPGESPGVVRLVAPRNGVCSGQIVVRADKQLTGLAASIAPLETPGPCGPATIPATAASVLAGVPFPRDDWTLKRLGDERGLGAWFPDAAELAACQTIQPGKSYVFDGLRSTLPTAIPADTAWPIWVSLRVPEEAVPGKYRGVITLAAKAGIPEGAGPQAVPVELEVIDWRLPDPKDFRTLVGCEQNPYAVAKQHGLKLWSDEHFRMMESSFRQLGRIGNKWVNVPVIINTEFGNRDDSPIRWTVQKNGLVQAGSFDFSIMDRYLDLAAKHWGQPRVIQFIVEHGMKGNVNPPPVGQVSAIDAAGKATVINMDCSTPAAKLAWKAFAVALHERMKARKQDQAMFWGAPLEGEADPQLKAVLAEAVPGVYWTAGPHEMMSNGTFAKDERFYRCITTIRYWGNWPSFRMDMGWKSKTPHLLNPRPGGTVFAMHTTSYPFAYRVLADRCIAMGRSGFTCVGADDWAATHFSGMAVPRWLTGVPVLFVLWPGKDGAESSVRFEALLEGIQEAEARIAVEQALDSGKLTGEAATKARKVLADNMDQTRFFLGNSIIHAFEQYHYRWQQRAADVYRAASQLSGQ